MLTLLLANGKLTNTACLPDLLTRATLVIAVDGGANHCRQLGVTPNLLIGDLDSIDPATLKEFQENDVVIHRHPPRKDATDLELALDIAVERGAGQVWLLGGLGGRWDMSLANILLAAAEKYKTLSLHFAGEDCILHVLHAGHLFIVEDPPGRQISFLPLQGDVCGLSLKGFEYPVDNVTLPFGTTRGISNVLRNSPASVTFKSGVLLCIRLLSE